VDQLVAVHREAVDRRGLAGLGQAGVEERRSVIGDDAVERLGHIGEGTGKLTVIAVTDTE